MFSGFNLFDLTRFLIVLGFTLTIIRYTSDLTQFKSPRANNRKKLKLLGIGGIVVGIAVGLLSMYPTIKNEAISIKGMGTDIIAVGFSCIFQYKFSTKKQQRYLMWGALSVIILGLMTGIIAVFATVFKWF